MENPQTSAELRKSSIRKEAKCNAGCRFDEQSAHFPQIATIAAAGARTEFAQRRQPQLAVASEQSVRLSGTPLARTALGGVEERRRLEQDLHDGVQNELVALIVKLAVVAQDPDMPPALTDTLAELEGRAQAALDSVRNIARGISAPLLADLGIAEALHAQAARAAVDVSLEGTAPRSTAQVEEAVYFACSEAIQNAAKHAGRTARVTLRLHHRRKSLVVQIADDGRGFDPAHTPEGAGLQNIRDRSQAFGGTFTVASKPGCGTRLTISLPWPPRADQRQ